VRDHSSTSLENQQKQTIQPAKIQPKRVFIPKTEIKNRDEVNRSRVYDFISHEPIKDSTPITQTLSKLGSFELSDTERQYPLE
jgi:hypothetical protein